MPRFIISRPKITAMPMHGGERGFALISVLWLVALMGVLALGILSLARNDGASARAALEEAQAEGWADAGIFLVVHELCNMKTAKDVPVDGSARRVRVMDRDVTVSVQDEGGKIDINFAPKEMLQSLFLTVGLPETKSVDIVEAIQAQRAEGFSVATIGWNNNNPSQISRSLPFLMVEQIEAIPGMTEDLFARIEPALTVYSQQPIVLAATAPREVLLSLPTMTDQNVEKVFAERQKHPVTAGSLGITDTMAKQGASFGRAFTIVSEARGGNSVFSRCAVVLVTGKLAHPFEILDWKIHAPRVSFGEN